MFLRCTNRKKDGKEHRYWNIVENRRVAGGRVVQRQVLYLGEINGSQREAWRKTIEVFEDGSPAKTMALFPEDRPVAVDDEQVVQIRLKDVELRRPRQWGACWLACTLYEQLGLDAFWAGRLPPSRKGTRWDLIAQALCCYRLIDPGSEWRLHRHWYETSAMADLLGAGFELVEIHKLYECLSRLITHKRALFDHLTQRWRDLFNVKFDVLLYDLTSTYFESNPPFPEEDKRRYGHSRDKRSDCVQVVVALVITPDGFPLAYEVLAGNTADKTTLRGFLQKIEDRYGKARRTWIMDRGIPCEATLAEMRADGVDYLVGTPRSMLSKLEQSLTNLPWQQARQDVRVKLFQQDGEVYVLAQSQARRKKEMAMRRRKLRKLWDGLGRLRKNCRDRDRLRERLAVLKHEAGRAAHMVEIEAPAPGEPVNEKTFRYILNRN